MFLRLAFAEAGCVPPDGDLYARVSGVENETAREGIKKVVNAMFFR